MACHLGAAQGRFGESVQGDVGRVRLVGDVSGEYTPMLPILRTRLSCASDPSLFFVRWTEMM